MKTQRPTSLHHRSLPGTAAHNFTSAFTVITTIAAGFLAAIWGAIFSSVPLVVAGFLISLLGTALYGWSLSAGSFTNEPHSEPTACSA